MIDVLDIISSIEEEKRRKNIAPTHALFSEIEFAVQERIKLELNQAFIEKKVNYSRTLNSFAFSITKNQ